MLLPATTGSGESALSLHDALPIFTVVAAVAVSGVVGSAVAEATDAVFDRSVVWAALTLTTIVTSGALATVSEARVQVTVVVPVHVQPVPVAETSFVPAGSGSETESELAFDGPALVTDSV